MNVWLAKAHKEDISLRPILVMIVSSQHNPSCINQKLANFAAEKTFGPEQCLVYLKLPWIGNVLSKFENQSNKVITSCFYAVKPHVVYSTGVMLPSAKKDGIPTTQKSCVVYEFLCQCEAR